MKRLFDFVVALFGLIITLPFLLLFLLLIWLKDFHSPFYSPLRAGWNGIPFRMVKLRTMHINADKTGVTSTRADDKRITPIGHFIRRYKLDEFSQLWNVLIGQMSLVGPRPQVVADTALYTPEERHLLDVRPGITDLSSIVFSDEGEILAGSDDPDLKYNQVIRPWKSRLGLLYVRKHSLLLDFYIIILTIITIFSRKLALTGVQRILVKLGADSQLIKIARREEPLTPYPPPGSNSILTTRNI